MKAAEVTIRPAMAADNVLLAELGAQTFADTFTRDNTPANMAAYLAASFSPNKQAAELADPASVFLIAEVGGIVAGYARLKQSQPPPGVTGARPIEIVRFYARREWLGQGVGAALMQACLGEAERRGCDTIWLAVWERNSRARAFYRKWGFVEVGNQIFQLGDDRQNDLILQRAVNLYQDRYARYITTLQAQLQEQASAQTKAWWEAYMKQAIPFRGVKMPAIRSVLHSWYTDNGLPTTLTLAEQKDLALILFQAEYAEDKLAAILFLQEILLPEGAIAWPEDLPRLAALFSEQWIFDWNICDWFCMKVLGPLIESEGPACAEAVAGWRTADNLWQARAAVVAFIAHTANPTYYPLIQNSAQVLIRRDERFAKTAVGWILRDISKHDRNFVQTFLDSQLSHFSPESLKNATKYFEKREQSDYLQRLKAGAAGERSG